MFIKTKQKETNYRVSLLIVSTCMVKLMIYFEIERLNSIQVVSFDIMCHLNSKLLV